MLDLTSQEKQAVVFLLCITFIGMAAYALEKKCTHVARFVQVRNQVVKLDLNRASFDELMATRAVSERLARKIIEYRVSAGRLYAVDDLKSVKGIGQKRLEKLKEYLFVE